MPQYDVEGCKINSAEISRLLNQVQNFDRIVFKLERCGTTDDIDLVDIYAEDNAGNRLTNVNVESRNRGSVNLNNAFITNFGQYCFITKIMITAFGSPSFELKARKHHYRGTEHPNHTGKHFIGYKVKIKS